MQSALTAHKHKVRNRQGQANYVRMHGEKFNCSSLNN